LDPLVAEQKRRLHLELASGLPPVRGALKTDSFEEAYGDDSPLQDLLPLSARWLVLDGAPRIASRARSRIQSKQVDFLAADIRRLPIRTASLDLVFSNSTLDHFEDPRDFVIAVGELARVLRPSGGLVFTTDNPLNPGYWLLRAVCSLPFAPFPLGYSPGPATLRRILEEAGFTIERTGFLIHNPRGLSTVLFLFLRGVLGKHASGPIRGALAAFEALGRLPTRALTACYLTVRAVRRP
jgi:SAM-dependent methyltransferase